MKKSLHLSPFRGSTSVCVGHVTHDHYGTDILAGGCSFYGARALAALGVSSKLLTSVGSDFRCTRDLEGIDTKIEIGEETTTFRNLYPFGKPRLQISVSKSESLTPSMIPGPWKSPDILMLVPTMGELDMDGWIGNLRPRFAAVGLQGFMKQAGGREIDGGRVVVPVEGQFPLKDIGDFDVVFLSQEDVVLFASGELLDILRREVPIVSVTDGENGCRVYKGDEEWSVGIYETECVDPTGAGDTFAAAMSIALAKGWSPPEAARLGAAAASVVVEGRGGETLSRVGEAFERFSGVHASKSENNRWGD